MTIKINSGERCQGTFIKVCEGGLVIVQCFKNSAETLFWTHQEHNHTELCLLPKRPHVTPVYDRWGESRWCPPQPSSRSTIWQTLSENILEKVSGSIRLTDVFCLAKKVLKFGKFHSFQLLWKIQIPNRWIQRAAFSSSQPAPLPNTHHSVTLLSLKRPASFPF